MTTRGLIKTKNAVEIRILRNPDGSKVICSEEIVTTFKVVKYYNPAGKQEKETETLLKREVKKALTFTLREISTEELQKLREMRIPSFVLKEKGILYHSEIPDDMNFVGIKILGVNTVHLCAEGRTCVRLSAAKEDQGGCEKVRDKSTGIEKYPWIYSGYESFATKRDVFVVTECSHFREEPERKPIPTKDIIKAKIGIAEYFFDETISNKKEASAMIEANIRRYGI